MRSATSCKRRGSGSSEGGVSRMVWGSRHPTREAPGARGGAGARERESYLRVSRLGAVKHEEGAPVAIHLYGGVGVRRATNWQPPATRLPRRAFRQHRRHETRQQEWNLLPPKNHVCDNSVNIADCSPCENMLFLLCWPRRAEIRLGAAPRGRRSGASVNFYDFHLARVSMHTTSSFSHGDRHVFRNPARAREDTSRRLSRATKKVFSKKKRAAPANTTSTYSSLRRT